MNSALALIGLTLFVTLASSSGLKKLETGESGIGILTSYYWSDIPKSWNDANQDCRDNGGNLVAPTSRVIDDNIANIIRVNNIGTSPLWTDGVYDAAASRWAWATSRRAIQMYFNWLPPNEPSRQTSTSYMAVAGGISTYGWISYPGNTKLQYLCSNAD